MILQQNSLEICKNLNEQIFLISGTVLTDTSLQSGILCNGTCTAVAATTTGLGTTTTVPLLLEEIFQFLILVVINQFQDADITSSTRVMLKLPTSYLCMDVSHCLRIRLVTIPKHSTSFLLVCTSFFCFSH